MRQPTGSVPAIRIDPRNPNHHLYNNHGNWWLHYTVHYADYTKRRIRVSLKTRDLPTARRQRDEIFARLIAEADEGGR
jgi:hypothetical protein